MQFIFHPQCDMMACVKYPKLQPKPTKDQLQYRCISKHEQDMSGDGCCYFEESERNRGQDEEKGRVRGKENKIAKPTLAFHFLKYSWLFCTRVQYWLIPPVIMGAFLLFKYYY